MRLTIARDLSDTVLNSNRTAGVYIGHLFHLYHLFIDHSAKLGIELFPVDSAQKSRIAMKKAK